MNGQSSRGESPLPRPVAAGPSDATPVSDQVVLAVLAEVIDPEIGLDVVTLGLIYDVQIEGGVVIVRYTLTTRGCPLERLMSDAIVQAVRRAPGVEQVRLDLVWEPEWQPGMIRTRER